MEKVTGMMKQKEKSSRDHLETVIESMSLEEMEWSISIAGQEEVQECGDVIFLIVMVYCRASTSTLALLRQVYSCVCGVPCLMSINIQVDCRHQLSTSLWSLRLMRILLSSLSHVRVEEDQSQRWSGGGME